MRIIWFLCVLIGCIAIHEGGHYLAMRHYGVEVEEVSIGVGPKLLEKRLPDGTMVRLRPVVLGGYTAPSKPGIATMEALPFVAVSVINLAGVTLNLATGFLGLLFLRLHGTAPFFGGGRRRAGTIGGLACAWHAAVDVVAFTVMAPLVMLRGLFLLFTRRGRKELQDRKDASKEDIGLNPYAETIVMVSLLLGTVNLLPFIPFDGSKIVLFLINAASPAAATIYIDISFPVAIFMVFFCPFTPIDYYTELRHHAETK